MDGHMAGYIRDIEPGSATMNDAQKRAVDAYRSRLAERGLSRFEVLGAHCDREFLRSFARWLAEGGPDASRVRSTIESAMGVASSTKGNILAALMNSPLRSAGIRLDRDYSENREPPNL
jgi:hypothetical protein